MTETSQQVLDWKKHPRYLADAGGLFCAPPQLVCQNCKKNDYELFYGHCRNCAEEKNIPQNTAKPEKFNKALSSGCSTIMEGVPKNWYPWWSWRHWFNR